MSGLRDRRAEDATAFSRNSCYFFAISRRWLATARAQAAHLARHPLPHPYVHDPQITVHADKGALGLCFTLYIIVDRSAARRARELLMYGGDVDSIWK